MKELFTPFRNWRVWCLCIMALPAIILLLGEAEDIATFLAGKFAGTILALSISYLAAKWHSEGKINELEHLIDER